MPEFLDHELVQALILGLVQGLTEFVPVSSSGHLVLLPALLGWPTPSLLMLTVLHLGTLTALVLAYRKDMATILTGMFRSLRERRMVDYAARDGWFLLLATVPAGIACLVVEPFVSDMLDKPVLAAWGLIGTACLLGGGELVAWRREHTRYIEEMGWKDAAALGLAQAVALIPGVSRSGAVMATGRFLALDRAGAARFAFLLGAPVIAAAGAKELLGGDLTASGEGLVLIAALAVGFLASAAAGWLAIKVLLAYLRHRTLWVFAAWCLVVGLVLIGVLPGTV